jgi:5-methylcytosine-specific restriction endonuclease McrA
MTAIKKARQPRNADKENKEAIIQKMNTAENHEQNNYQEKLRQPAWQKKRLEIFARDNCRCTNCGSINKELQIHYIDYLKNFKPWQYPDDMLTTLCSSCHLMEKSRSKAEDYLLQAFEITGFFAGDLLKVATLLHNKHFADRFKIILRRDGA